MTAPLRSGGRLPRQAPVLPLLLVLVLVSSAACVEGTPRQSSDPPAAGSSGAGDLYVGPRGDDDAPGTLDAPWRTLDHALGRLRAGDRLHVRGGTYEEDVEPELSPGTSRQRITVRPYRDERVVVRGLVRLTQPDYWTVEDLELTWGGGSFDDHMVKVSGGRGWVLDGLRIHGSRSRAGLLIAKSVSGGAPHDYVLRNSAVYDSTKGANLYLNPGRDATGGLVEHNLFFGSPTENVKIGFGGSCRAQRDELFGAGGVVLRHNTLHDAREPLTIAEPADGIEVYRNIISSTRDRALLRLSGECGNLGSDISVRDNLGAGADRWCQEYDSPITCEDVDDGGNHFPLDPLFDEVDVDGLRPEEPAARGYGRYAGR